MTKRSGGDTINAGSAPEPDRDKQFEGIEGNVRERGEDPSPDDRERGETSDADPPAPVDLEIAHDRAS